MSIWGFTQSLYQPAWWTVFHPPFEGNLVPIIFLCGFSSYRSYASMWTVPKSCPFVEKVGKPQNWSAIRSGCLGLTPWSAGGSLPVPAPSAAVPSTPRGLACPGGGGCRDGRDPHPHWRMKGIQVVPPYPLLRLCQLLPVGGCGGRSDAFVGKCGCQDSRFRGQHNEGGDVQGHLQCRRLSHPQRG